VLKKNNNNLKKTIGTSVINLKKKRHFKLSVRKVELFCEPGEIQRGTTDVCVVPVRHQSQYVMRRKLYQ
jgi:hypothetical protein